jgi:hypothetical protein
MNFGLIAARAVLLLLLSILEFLTKTAKFIKWAKIEIFKFRVRIWRNFEQLKLAKREIWKIGREIWRVPGDAAKIINMGTGVIVRIFWPKIKRIWKRRSFRKARSKRAKNRKLKRKETWWIILIKPTDAEKFDQEIPEKSRGLDDGMSYSMTHTV